MDASPTIAATREEGLRARVELLAAEKELAGARAELSPAATVLPWPRVDEHYLSHRRRPTHARRAVRRVSCATRDGS